MKTSVPITMPSAIAIRMYCVNLFDIFLTPKFRRRRVWQIPGATQHASQKRQAKTSLDGSEFGAFATMFPLWNERLPTSVVRCAQCVQLSVFCAVNCIKNRHTEGTR